MKLIKAPMHYLVGRKIPFMRGKKGYKSGRFLFDQSMGWAFTMSRLPGMVKIHPWFREDLSDIRWLPVEEKVEVPSSVPIPIELLDRFIEEASKRYVITGGCGCRIACGCKDYPQEIGCLFLGDSADEVPEAISSEVTVEEAKAHVKKALDAGLVPLIGKVGQDNTIFGVKERRRLVTICFCCECCCISRILRFVELEDLDPVFPRLDGVVMEITDDCKGCGKCVDSCYIKALSVPYGKAQISEYCRACGRCIKECPKGAIKMKITDPEYLDKAYERILAYTRHN